VWLSASVRCDGVAKDREEFHVIASGGLIALQDPPINNFSTTQPPPKASVSILSVTLYDTGGRTGATHYDKKNFTTFFQYTNFLTTESTMLSICSTSRSINLLKPSG
jgi:hypothetical protein